MELRLTVKKAGSTRGKGPEAQEQWQKLRKVIRKAHRPVVFEVGGLIPDTRCGMEWNYGAKLRSPKRSGIRPTLARTHNERKAASQRNPNTEPTGLTHAKPSNPCYHGMMCVYSPR